MDQSKEVQVFNFQGNQEIRTVIQDGELWFVANDVCRILDIVNSRQAVESLDDDEKGLRIVYTPGGNQTMNCVNESGRMQDVDLGIGVKSGPLVKSFQ